MSLLKQDIIKKRQVNNTLPTPEKEFEARNDKKNEVKAIITSVVYGKEWND